MRNFFEKLALLPVLMDIVEEMAKESLQVEEERKCKKHCECKCGKHKRPTCVLTNGFYTGKAQGWEEWDETPILEESEPMVDMDREPDGVDIHVDRPRIENYYSRHEWAHDMANYRMLIDQAKKCDWPCKEPMKGIPNYVSHIQRDWYDEHPNRW